MKKYKPKIRRAFDLALKAWLANPASKNLTFENLPARMQASLIYQATLTMDRADASNI